LNPTEVDLTALVGRVVETVRPTQPDLVVDFSCEPDLRVTGDPVLLERAFYNLLENAWKFSSKQPAPRVHVGRAETERGLAFLVEDNGAGFDPRHARRLFGAFQRMHTQDEFPGTGVGLASVQRIVHRHGGEIWAESEPGVGTRFYFTLRSPRSEPPPV
jgi:signal transduction histidine kinase